MLLAVTFSMDGVVDSFYRMLTLSQLQKLLRCSRATLYRTVKRAKIELYYVPNHPGHKYVWACSLLKLIGTPAVKKLAKRVSSNCSMEDEVVAKFAKKLGLTKKQATIGLLCGLLPIVNDEIPWWYEKAVKGLLVLPLPYK